MSGNTRAFVFLIALSAHTLALADTQAPITSVVLYPGTATIERSISITPGMRQAEIKGLPANFDKQTIRVQASPGIRVGQVVMHDIGRTEALGKREAEIEAQIEALKDQQATLNVDAQSAQLVQRYLENLSGSGAAATDKQQPYIDAKSMAAVLEAIRQGGRDAFDRIQRVKVQNRDIARKIDALQRDLARVQNGARDARDLTIQLSAKQAGTLKISYQVNGAGWKPTYRAMLDSSTSSVELERLATVSQKTGEDWRGIALKLSTGQPRLSPAAPEPRPWLLSYHKPRPMRAERRMEMAQMAAPAALGGQAKLADHASEDDYVAPVMETHGAFATEFEVPARVDLPSDGREVSVSLSTQRVPVKQRVRVVPRMDRFGVLTAEAERPSGVWLPGSMQLLRDGNYVGATQWDAQSSDRFVFSFGRDNLLRVTVDRTKEQSGSGGLLSQRSERKVSDLYTFTSFHKTPIELLVLEPSPVSTSDEIKVQAAYSIPPGLRDWENRQGVVGWEKSLAPNETMKLGIDYAITYPQEGLVPELP